MASILGLFVRRCFQGGLSGKVIDEPDGEFIGRVPWFLIITFVILTFAQGGQVEPQVCGSCSGLWVNTGCLSSGPRRDSPGPPQPNAPCGPGGDDVIV